MKTASINLNILECKLKSNLFNSMKATVLI